MKFKIALFVAILVQLSGCAEGGSPVTMTVSTTPSFDAAPAEYAPPPGEGLDMEGNVIPIDTPGGETIKKPATAQSPSSDAELEDALWSCLSKKIPGTDRDIVNHTRAFNPNTGQNFVYDKGKNAWIDAKTGEAVCPKSVSAAGLEDALWSCLSKRIPGTDRDIVDHTRAFNPNTGQNFVYDKDKNAWIDAKTGECICPKCPPSDSYGMTPRTGSQAPSQEAVGLTSATDRHASTASFEENRYIALPRFSIGAFGSGSYTGRDGENWYNGMNGRSGNLDGWGGGFGLDMRIYSAFMIGNAAMKKIDFFLNAQIGGLFGNDSWGAIARRHFGVGNDTGMAVDEYFRTRIGLGMKIMAYQEASLWGIGGLQLSQYDINGYTDESSGGGTYHEFHKSTLLPGGYFGLEARVPLHYDFMPKGSFLTFSATASKVGDANVNGTTVPGRNYDYRLNQGWGSDIAGGFHIPF